MRPPRLLMNLRSKNLLTATLLGLLALSFYIYAMPSAVIEQLAKALRAVFNG
jgi:hypothetical protein